MKRKTLYLHTNLVVLKNGASIKLQNLNNLTNLKLFSDNYDIYYISKLVKKSTNLTPISKKTQIYTFYNKFNI